MNTKIPHKLNRAKELLSHYLRLAGKGDLTWDSDNEAEVNDLIDYIFEASVEEAISRFERAAQDAQPDPPAETAQTVDLICPACFALREYDPDDLKFDTPMCVPCRERYGLLRPLIPIDEAVAHLGTLDRLSCTQCGQAFAYPVGKRGQPMHCPECDAGSLIIYHDHYKHKE